MQLIKNRIYVFIYRRWRHGRLSPLSLSSDFMHFIIHSCRIWGKLFNWATTTTNVFDICFTGCSVKYMHYVCRTSAPRHPLKNIYTSFNCLRWSREGRCEATRNITQTRLNKILLGRRESIFCNDTFYFASYVALKAVISLPSCPLLGWMTDTCKGSYYIVCHRKWDDDKVNEAGGGEDGVRWVCSLMNAELILEQAAKTNNYMFFVLSKSQYREKCSEGVCIWMCVCASVGLRIIRVKLMTIKLCKLNCSYIPINIISHTHTHAGISNPIHIAMCLILHCYIYAREYICSAKCRANIK